MKKITEPLANLRTIIIFLSLIVLLLVTIAYHQEKVDNLNKEIIYLKEKNLNLNIISSDKRTFRITLYKNPYRDINSDTINLQIILPNEQKP